MASPFPAFTPHDESEIIEPAVDGTINVLEACSKARIKRVVLTSSIAAVHACKDNITNNLPFATIIVLTIYCQSQSIK